MSKKYEARRHIPMYMKDWEGKRNDFLNMKLKTKEVGGVRFEV